MPIRVALVGAGAHGHSHASAMNYLGTNGMDIKYELVVDVNPARAAILAAEFKIPHSGDLGLLSGFSGDGVDICTPTHTHLEIAEICVSLGLPVLIDKPLSQNFHDADFIINTFKNAKVPLQIGYSTRFDPLLFRLKQSISDGVIGIPGLVTINHLQGYSWANGWSAWQQNGQKSGGRIIHFGIHDLDFACWVMESRPVSVRTIASKKIDQTIASWTSYSAQILFESGALALVTGNWDVIPANYWRKTCSVIGSTGSIKYDSADDEISLNSQNIEPVGYLASIINELKHWMECLVGDTQPIVSLEQARMSLALAVAAQNSAENHGATVQIEEILHGSK